MANINDLGLDPNKAIEDVDYDNLPAGIGGAIIVPPQPGTYLFRLPSEGALFSCFSRVEGTDFIAAVFRDAAALLNVTLNEPYNTRLTNVVRFITLKGEQVAISDLASLLKAVDSRPEQSTNGAYTTALIKAAGREFMADHTLTANCNPKSDTYAYNPNTGRSEPRTGIKGCGEKYRVEGYVPKSGGRPVLSIPRDEDGKIALRFTCTCGSELRAWGQLQGFRPAK